MAQGDKKSAKKIVPSSFPEKRKDIPSAEELMLEYEEGQFEDPPITYRDMANKYGCAPQTIHNRITRFVKKTKVTRPTKETIGHRAKIEQNITNKIVEAFIQLKENCGDDAVERALKVVSVYVEEE